MLTDAENLAILIACSITEGRLQHRRGGIEPGEMHEAILTLTLSVFPHVEEGALSHFIEEQLLMLEVGYANVQLTPPVKQDPRAGDLLTLRGKTLKGKNRVREHGETWVVVKAHPVLGLHVEPEVQRNRWPEKRWINPTNDPNFEITSVRPPS